jgi:hypothetical protein
MRLKEVLSELYHSGRGNLAFRGEDHRCSGCGREEGELGCERERQTPVRFPRRAVLSAGCAFAFHHDHLGSPIKLECPHLVLFGEVRPQVHLSPVISVIVPTRSPPPNSPSSPASPVPIHSPSSICLPFALVFPFRDDPASLIYSASSSSGSRSSFLGRACATGRGRGMSALDTALTSSTTCSTLVYLSLRCSSAVGDSKMSAALTYPAASLV